MSATKTATANGNELLKLCRYNHEICAALIVSQPNWRELLDTIESPSLRESIESIVLRMRVAMGME